MSCFLPLGRERMPLQGCNGAGVSLRGGVITPAFLHQPWRSSYNSSHRAWSASVVQLPGPLCGRVRFTCSGPSPSFVQDAIGRPREFLQDASKVLTLPKRHASVSKGKQLNILLQWNMVQNSRFESSEGGTTSCTPQFDRY